MHRDVPVDWKKVISRSSRTYTATITAKHGKIHEYEQGNCLVKTDKVSKLMPVRDAIKKAAEMNIASEPNDKGVRKVYFVEEV